MNIFLSAPLTKVIDLKTNLVDDTFKGWLTKIIEQIEQKGHSVFSAHMREKWGKQLYLPSDAIVDDFRGVDECDKIIAFIGNPISAGVLLELGYASAKKKEIVIFTDSRWEVPYLVRGIDKITKAKIITYHSFIDLQNLIDKEL